MRRHWQDPEFRARHAEAEAPAPKPTAPVAPAPPPDPVLAVAPAGPPPDGIPFLARSRDQCGFPLWGDKERPSVGEHRVCGAPVDPEAWPYCYCPRHLAIATVRSAAARRALGALR